MDRSDTSWVDTDFQLVLVSDLDKLDVLGEDLGDVCTEISELFPLYALWHERSRLLLLNTDVNFS